MPHKYIIIKEEENSLTAYSPSKYAGLFNIGPLTSGKIFDDKEKTQSVANHLPDFKVTDLKTAIITDIEKCINAAQNALKEKNHETYVRNKLLTIEMDFDLLKKHYMT